MLHRTYIMPIPVHVCARSLGLHAGTFTDFIDLVIITRVQGSPQTGIKGERVGVVLGGVCDHIN